MRKSLRTAGASVGRVNQFLRETYPSVRTYFLNGRKNVRFSRVYKRERIFPNRASRAFTQNAPLRIFKREYSGILASNLCRPLTAYSTYTALYNYIFYLRDILAKCGRESSFFFFLHACPFRAARWNFRASKIHAQALFTLILRTFICSMIICWRVSRMKFYAIRYPNVGRLLICILIA